MAVYIFNFDVGTISRTVIIKYHKIILFCLFNHKQKQQLTIIFLLLPFIYCEYISRPKIVIQSKNYHNNLQLLSTSFGYYSWCVCIFTT